MAIIVGSVAVRVVPDTSQFTNILRSKMSNVGREMGEKVGEQVGESLNQTLGKKKIEPKISTDQINRALLALVAVSSAANAVDRKRVNIRVDVDNARAVRALNQIGDSTAVNTGKLGAMGAAMFALGAAAIPLASAVAPAIAAIGIAVTAATAGIAVFVLAIVGIPAAVSAMIDVQTKAAEIEGQLAVRRRQNIVAAEGVRRAADGIRIAEASLTNARANAASGQIRAENAVRDAQQSSVDTQRDLNKARLDAAQAMQQLNAEVNRAGFSERQAVLDLERARLKLEGRTGTKAVAGGKPPDDLQGQQDQLDFDEAVFQLDEIRRRRKQLAAEKAVSDREGVNGSKRVLDAQSAIINANERVAEAQRQQIEQSRTSAASIASADQARIDAVEALATAQLALDTQLEKTGETGATALDKMREEMAKLSPAGRDFAIFIAGARDRVKDLQASAQQGLFPGVQAGLQDLMRDFPAFNDFVGSLATSLGQGFRLVIDSLQSPVWKAFFSYLDNEAGNILKDWLKILLGIGEGFASMMTAFAPQAREFTKSLLRWAEGFRTVGKSVGFRDFMDYVRRTLPSTVQAIKDIWKGLKALVVAAAPIGTIVLRALGNLGKAIANIPTKVLTFIIGALAVIIGLIKVLSISQHALTALQGPFNLIKKAVLTLRNALFIQRVETDKATASLVANTLAARAATVYTVAYGTAAVTSAGASGVYAFATGIATTALVANATAASAAATANTSNAVAVTGLGVVLREYQAAIGSGLPLRVTSVRLDQSAAIAAGAYGVALETVTVAMRSYNVALEASTLLRIASIRMDQAATSSTVANTLAIESSTRAHVANRALMAGSATARAAETAATRAATTATVANTAAVKANRTAWALNPLGVVIIAIGAIVVAFVLAFRRSQALRDAVERLGRAIGDFANAAWEGISKFVQTVSDAHDPLGLLTNVFTQIVSDLADMVDFIHITSKVMIEWAVQFADKVKWVAAGITTILLLPIVPFVAGITVLVNLLSGGSTDKGLLSELLSIQGILGTLSFLINPIQWLSFLLHGPTTLSNGLETRLRGIADALGQIATVSLTLTNPPAFLVWLMGGPSAVPEMFQVRWRWSGPEGESISDQVNRELRELQEIRIRSDFTDLTSKLNEKAITWARKLEDAERKVNDAVRDRIRAIEDVEQAKLDARRGIKDSASAVKSAEFSKDRARIARDDAQFIKDQVFKNPKSTARERLDAQLTLDEANLAYADAQRRLRELRQDDKKIRNEGVDKNRGVQDAISRRDETLRAEASAIRELKKAEHERALENIADKALSEAAERRLMEIEAKRREANFPKPGSPGWIDPGSTASENFGEHWIQASDVIDGALKDVVKDMFETNVKMDAAADRMGTVSEKFGEHFNTIVQDSQIASDTIGGHWFNNLVQKLMDARKALVDRVFTPLVGVFNAFLQGLGFGPNVIKLPKFIDPIAGNSGGGAGGFAAGGIYPGYTPGRDIGYAGVSGGEAIMRPEWTRAVTPDYVHAANAAARRGGVEEVKRFLGGFAGGGVVGGGTGKSLLEKFHFPMPGKIVSGYGMRNGRLHDGLDIANRQGTPIVAAWPGTVYKVEHGNSGWGNQVVLAHGLHQGLHLFTRYAHMITTAVKNAQQVLSGQHIGNEGSTGRSSGPHLHFGVYRGNAPNYGTSIDPKKMFDSVAGGWPEVTGDLGAGLAGKSAELSAQTKGPLAALLGMKSQPGVAGWLARSVAPKTEFIEKLMHSKLGQLMSGVGTFLDKAGNLIFGDGTADSRNLDLFRPGIARWAPIVAAVLAQLGQNPLLLPGMLRRLAMESGGNPNAINLDDRNAKEGHPSQGLMQTIPSTFAAHAGIYRRLGILNPLANVYAGLHYALKRYKDLRIIDPQFAEGLGYRGYDTGGYLPPGLTLAYNGTGQNETIRTAQQERALNQPAIHHIRVFIGNEEFKGYIDTRVDRALDDAGNALIYGVSN